MDTVEIRSQVIEGDNYIDIIENSSFSLGEDNKYIEINSTNFAGFYYDIDDNVKPEKMTFSLGGKNADKSTIGEGALKYEIKPEKVEYEGFDNEDYYVAGFFAEKFVPVFEENELPTNEVLAKLLVDNDDAYTLRTGEKLELGAGYSIEAKQVDVDGKKAWLTFLKDDEIVDDKIINIPTEANKDADPWNVTQDVADIDDAVVARVQVDEVFQGAVDSIVQIEGLWLIDYENPVEIDTGDEFGDFEVKEANVNRILLKNTDDDITLDRDSVEDLYGNLKFRVADNETLRFYPFSEAIIGDGEKPVDEPDDTEEPVDVPDDNETVSPDEPEQPIEEPEEPAGPEEPSDEPEEPEDNGIPGFGFVFGLAGLLAVVYLVRRN
ncbi:MAG: S-layer protein domain-containing protein [Methanosarcinaceae archaeon]|nr:S-layer protein domain-containing protein [Methanosarcinaceae archaeon]